MFIASSVVNNQVYVIEVACFLFAMSNSLLLPIVDVKVNGVEFSFAKNLDQEILDLTIATDYIVIALSVIQLQTSFLHTLPDQKSHIAFSIHSKKID